MAEEEEGGPGGPQPPAPVILQPGQVVQGYEIMKPLGKGKFSIVYMAKRLADGLVCALKKINIFDMMVPKQREKCLKEVRLLQSLDHPNIVKLLNSLIDNNELLIIVEWAEKGDLKRLIRKAVANKTNFKESEIWEYSRQLAGALDHMHRKRIMHRDLKPANIFVSSDGSLKLGDLGLGRFFSSQTLEAFSKVGTPLYMSPEVLHGAGYDMRSDVWSLGCVIYELAMLRSPFKSDQQLSLYDLFVRISKGQYPPLPETSSIEFRGLVNQMLQLDPARRLESSQVLEVCTTRLKHLSAVTAAAPPLPVANGSRAASQPGHNLEQQPQPQTQTPQQKPQVPQHSQPSPSAPDSRPLRPSPLLVMDDIVEKLKLLECEENLLQPRGFPILHRCFFTQALKLPGGLTQFEVLHELLRWLLSMLEDRESGNLRPQAVPAADASAGPCLAPTRGSDVGAGDAAAGCGARRNGGSGGGSRLARYSRGHDTAELIRATIAALKGRGIQISSDATVVQLNQGYGEGVCLILNELINQELMARDFHFEHPAWGTKSALGRCGEEVLSEPDDIIDETAGGDSFLDPSDGSNEEQSETTEDTSSHTAGVPSCLVEEHSLCAQPLIEPVHIAQIDSAAWRKELERVKPSLQSVMDASRIASDWRASVGTAQRLCQRVQDLGAQSLLPSSVRSCCRQWRDELARLQSHEDRVNVIFGDKIEMLAELRSAFISQTERLEELQASVTERSARLASLVQQVEQVTSETGGAEGARLDREQLPRLRKAVQRLRTEEVQLRVHVQLLQREVNSRRDAAGIATPLRSGS